MLPSGKGGIGVVGLVVLLLVGCSTTEAVARVQITVGPSVGAAFNNLQDAVAAASTSASPVSIVVQAGQYNHTHNCGLVVNASLGIRFVGAGTDVTVIDCAHANRFVTVEVDPSVPAAVWGSIEGMTVRRGAAVDGGEGGAILIQPTSGAAAGGVAQLELTDVVVVDSHANSTSVSGFNTASGGGGVAILRVANVVMQGVTIDGCTSSTHGGAMTVSHASNITLRGGEMRQSTTQQYGGCLEIGFSNSLVVEDVVFTGCTTVSSSNG